MKDLEKNKNQGSNLNKGQNQPQPQPQNYGNKDKLGASSYEKGDSTKGSVSGKPDQNKGVNQGVSGKPDMNKGTSKPGMNQGTAKPDLNKGVNPGTTSKDKPVNKEGGIDKNKIGGQGGTFKEDFPKK